MRTCLILILTLQSLIPILADPIAERAKISAILERRIIDPLQSKVDVEVYLGSRTLRFAVPSGQQAWRQSGDRLREKILREVVLRGEAQAWAQSKTQVVWEQEVIEETGYVIKKLRYEAIPGLWIPALLYQPKNASGKIPAILNVNGHDSAGKAAGYKQVRCINLAKKGVLALNVEWFGMGQLDSPGFKHYRMNQVDLCGTSGLALHYLYLKRAVDLLLSLPETDPDRVGVTGLSGGGWQTIFIGALDPRLSLINPVAGYSSYLTRVLFESDLGDSEQTPVDLGTVADYEHLTALLAPRPALLTFNAKDTCCFRADHALVPLLQAAQPVYALLNQTGRLRYHVNFDPGTHNFEKDNRQQLYALVKDFFIPSDPGFDATELPVDNELKTGEQLQVELPADNLDFHKIALRLADSLGERPVATGGATAEWKQANRKRLGELLRLPVLAADPRKVAEEDREGLTARYWKLRLGGKWTIPVTEIEPKGASRTVVLLGDEGRAALTDRARDLVQTGRRVIAVDPFYFLLWGIEDSGPGFPAGHSDVLPRRPPAGTSDGAAYLGYPLAGRKARARPGRSANHWAEDQPYRAAGCRDG